MSGPSCPCCYDVEFDERIAERDLREYRRHGPGKTTRTLASALAGDGDGASGLTVLDIGGGVGGLHRLLLEAGAASAVDIDASAPYLAAARREAQRLGLDSRIEFAHGDFVTSAPAVEAADLVGLDRVVCCYPDVDALVGAAARLTRRRLGIAVPRDGRFARFAVGAVNVWQRIIRSKLRMHAHDLARIEAAAGGAGLQLRSITAVGFWRVLLFERPQVGG
ncbi:MAG: methyltransferase domain-containing protein [Chloroflexi bacterium]|nr:methyltransferase domain-containing protein [Chloroflexota bacterium]